MKKQMQLVRCIVNGREVEEYVDVGSRYLICSVTVLDLPL